MVAGQVTIERPEEMVVTLAPYRCNSAWCIIDDIILPALIMRSEIEKIQVQQCLPSENILENLVEKIQLVICDVWN